MAVRQAQLVAPQYIGGTLAGLGITVGAGEIVRLEAVSGHNSHTSSAQISMHIVPTGASADATNLIHQAALAAGESYTVPALVSQRMKEGDTLQAVSTVADVVTIMVSGTRVTV